MSETSRASNIRVVTASVPPMNRSSRTLEEVTAVIQQEIREAGFLHVRHAVVKNEAHNIQQLVSNVSTDNEAEVVVFVGSIGFGPHDQVIEALDEVFERRIEGFGEAYRRLLRAEVGVHAALARATAGVFNECVVFALSGRAPEMKLAVQTLLAPIIPDAVVFATAGRAGAQAG
jgi:molybdenum cofactor biosynthesis protein B